MNTLFEGPDRLEVKEGRQEGSALTELSDTDLTRVAGGASCWMTGTSSSGTGLYHHSGYPLAE